MLSWFKRKKKVRVDYVGVSDQGGREENQDHLFHAGDEKTGRYAYVVADGLGGHGMGRTAARLAAVLMGRRMVHADSLSDALLAEAFEKTHHAIVNYEKENRAESDMKTTCVTLVIDDGKAYWGSVGDSRLYMFRDGRIFNKTKDHSVVQLLIDTGEISEDEARHHPDRNKVYQVMGGSELPRPFLQGEGIEVEPGDVFLLCSDGFWEFLDETVVADFLFREQDLAAKKLLKRVFKRTKLVAEQAGKRYDNLTAQLVKVV